MSPRPMSPAPSRDGDLVLKFGGAGDILLSTDKQVTDPRLFIDYHIIPGLYFSNGCTATSGSLLNWIVRQLAGGEQAAASAAGSRHPCLARPAGERGPGGLRGAGAAALFPRREDAAAGSPCPRHAHRPRPASPPRPYLAGGAGGRHLRLPPPYRGLRRARSRRRRASSPATAGRRATSGCRSPPMSSTGRCSASTSIPAPAWAPPMSPAMALGCCPISPASRAMSRAGAIFEPIAAHRPVYDRAYQNYRETYERLKTLYPRLDPGGER